MINCDLTDIIVIIKHLIIHLTDVLLLITFKLIKILMNIFLNSCLILFFLT